MLYKFFWMLSQINHSCSNNTGCNNLACILKIVINVWRYRHDYSMSFFAKKIWIQYEFAVMSPPSKFAMEDKTFAYCLIFVNGTLSEIVFFVTDKSSLISF